MSFYKKKLDVSSAELIQHFSVFVHKDKEWQCKNPEHYNSFIKYQAMADEEQGLGVTYLYIYQDDDTRVEKLAGYITIRMSCLIKDDLDSKHKHGFPALEIAELAVDEEFAGQGVGQDMVMDAINMANEINEMSSIKYIVLCADPSAVSFYKQSPLNFFNINDSYESIPREYANQDCIPMCLKLR
jgi:ribosomal protein S18 acetylase RimI-like enzyme